LKVAREQLDEEEEEHFEEDNYSDTSDIEQPEEGEEYIDAEEDYEEDDEEMQRQYAQKRVSFEGEEVRSSIDTSGIDSDLPPEVIEHYTRIGKFLSVYTVGKIPKGFKILPTRKQWEELLYFTNPVEWTPHAHYQATKIFASNLNDNLAQRYYNLVLLPAIRGDIKENKKLHFQLYQSLKKALFKPLAFMKGILLPLADSTDCTLREAVIVGSVLTKMTIPMAFGAAALFKLCCKADTWTPVKSVLITMLLNKKYSLPTAVVEGLVNHFSSFSTFNQGSKMPVLWHASLLTFAQRYKESLSEDQKSRILDLLLIHSHYQITPEIRRELMVADVAM
jgi:essential nuclear protein 1